MYRNHYTTATASGRVQAIRGTELPNLRDTYRAEAQAPIPNTNHLTAEGQRDRANKQREIARAKALIRLNELETEFGLNADVIRAHANVVNAPLTDPTAALLAEQRQTRAWNRALSLLNSGRSVHRVIATANDADTIAALRAELPTWITSQTPAQASLILGTHPDDEHDFNPLMRTLDQRLAQITPGPDSTVLKARVDLDRIEPGTRAFLNGLRMEIEHGQSMGLNTALEVHYTDAEAARTIPDPDTQTDTTTQGRAHQSLSSATSAHYNTGNDAA